MEEIGTSEILDAADIDLKAVGAHHIESTESLQNLGKAKNVEDTAFQATKINNADAENNLQLTEEPLQAVEEVDGKPEKTYDLKSGKDDLEAAMQDPSTSKALDEEMEGKTATNLIFGLSKTRLSLLVLVAAVFLLAIALLTTAINSLPMAGGVCRNISEIKRTGKQLVVAPDPVLINECKMKKCKFDVKACSESCPFGRRMDSEGCFSGCECSPSGRFQGDIQFSEDDVPIIMKMFDRSKDSDINKQSLNEMNSIWNSINVDNRYKIPYKFAKDFGNKTKQRVQAALQTFGLRTCLDFIEATKEPQFILIQKGEKCSSTLGFKQSGNTVTLNEDFCTSTPAVQHLFMHALGFHHENARPDRDLYIRIHRDQIKTGYEHAFSRLSWNTAIDLEVKYNTMSVMHFARSAFAKREGSVTTSGENRLRIRGDKVSDLYEGMQDSDYLLVNRMYQCPEHELVVHWSEWGNWKMDETRSTCSRFRSCLNSLNHTSVGCGSTKMETDSSAFNCKNVATTNSTGPQGRYAATGRIGEDGDMFTAPVPLDKFFCMLGTVVKGKFNGDNRDDLLCIYNDGWMRLYLANADGTFEQLDWEGQTKACRFDRARKLSGDLNGDGYTDLLCSYYSGKVQVLLFQEDRPFSNDEGFVAHIESCGTDRFDMVTLGDVDGDGKDDFICGDATNWFREVYLNVYEP